MKESAFINKNLDGWQKCEGELAAKETNPKKLSRQFVKITDDLSYAYTFYNNRSVRVYLNGISQKLFNRVNTGEKTNFRKLLRFYTHSVPVAMYKARKEVILAFLLFAVSMAIGIFSSKYDPEFAKLVLGDEYVLMTNENIAKNDPMAVYKGRAPFDMFFAITVNNCMVAIRTFVFGIFAAIGTVLIMLQNGIMVGTFQYYFVEQDLFKESFLTIWQHGIFEISSIIISGAAGLVLGKGIVFPGSYTRMQSLRISAQKGLRLLMGIIPILIVAGFIEGYYTRHTDAALAFRMATIIASIVFIIGYIVVLPVYRYRNSTDDTRRMAEINSSLPFSISKGVIYGSSEIFMLTFQVLKNNIKKILKYSFLLSIIFPAGIFLMNLLNISQVFENLNLHFSLSLINYNLPTAGIFALTISSIIFVLLRIQTSGTTKTNSAKHNLQRFLLLFFMHIPLIIHNTFFSLLGYVLTMSYTNLLLNISIQENKSIFRSISASRRYLKKNLLAFFDLTLRFSLMALLFYFVFSKLIAGINNEFIQMNLYGDSSRTLEILFLVNAFYFAFLVIFTLLVVYISMQIMLFSFQEISQPDGLISRIESIGNSKRIRGLVRE